MSCGAGTCARATSPPGSVQAEVVVEQTYRTPFVDHVYIETETGIGWIDAEGVLVLRVSTQVLEHFRDVADVLRLSHSRVRLEGAYLGGGFGGKEDVTVECLLGLLVWKTRRPVHLVFSREESFIGHGKRHPYILRYRTGARRDGELVALEAELISDSGAYAALSPWVLFYSLVTATGPYRVPHVHVDAVTAYTNNPIASAYRTFGSIQTCVAYEGQMDALAAALGMDPLELRERNFLARATASPPARCSRPTRCSARPCGAHGRRWARRAPAQGPLRIGRGLAASFTPYGRMCWTRDSASAWVGMELDGGRGGALRGARRGRRADVLALLDRRRGAGASRSTTSSRSGATATSRRARAPPRPRASSSCPATPCSRRRASCAVTSSIRRRSCSRRGRRTSSSPRAAPSCGARPTRAVTLGEVVRAMSASGRPMQVLDKYDAPSAPTIDPRTGQGKPFNDYTFGTQAVEVEVDAETGHTRVSRLVACYDIGQAINRQSAEGQIEGGAVQGLGHALLEAVALEDGIIRNPHLLDYKIPTTLDAPAVETILIESGNGLGPFGAKGIGEPAMTPTPAAVMNAVARAVGRPVTEFPHHRGARARTARSGGRGDGVSLALEFSLNGQPCRTGAPAHFTLLDLLRDGLALLGTKDGCGEGVCGACTVLLDGEPVRSCIVLAARVAGRTVVTIEGVGGEAPDPLQ